MYSVEVFQRVEIISFKENSFDGKNERGRVVRIDQIIMLFCYMMDIMYEIGFSGVKKKIIFFIYF